MPTGGRSLAPVSGNYCWPAITKQVLQFLGVYCCQCPQCLCFGFSLQPFVPKSQMGALAQRRLARGVKLNQPEAVALISSQLMERIRDGYSVLELMTLGKQLLGLNQVQPGVASLVSEVQIEATFQDGTKLLTIHGPIVMEDGELEEALRGSFLPVPDLSIFNQVFDLPVVPIHRFNF